MARSPAEIQAEIAVTREVIGRRLDALSRHAPRPLWLLLGLLAAGALTGVLLSRVPLIPILSASARAVQAGIGVAAAVATLRRALTAGPTAGARDVQRAPQVRKALRRAS